MDVLQFILVGDTSRARYLRRVLAENKTQIGVMVGTITSLINTVKEAYVLPVETLEWEHQFHDALAKMDAFWSGSFQVAPDETSKIVKQALVQLVTALPVDTDLTIEHLDSLELRPQHHINDLLALYQALNQTLENEYELQKQCILVNSNNAIRNIQVHIDSTVDNLSVWDQALIDKLNTDSKDCERNDFSCYLSKETVHSDNSAISILQNKLFQHVENSYELDETAQFVSVRDLIEEADIAAGMVQQILKQHTDLSEKDIGILIPNDFEYSLAVEDAFSRAGLSLSGFSLDDWRRDLSHEAIFHFLYCRQKPAPVMALSVCLSAALMPWSREDGAALAQQIMDGYYDLSAPSGSSKNSKLMLALINDGDDTPASLQRALRSFVDLLDDHGQYTDHLYRARQTTDLLCELLNGETDIPWKKLRRAATPKYIRNTSDTEFNLEGITVWRENQNPWRHVRYLLILGFSEGRYPSSVSLSPVFSVDDVSLINKNCALEMVTIENIQNARRSLFKQQLSYVTDFITFFLPRLKTNGDTQAPSDSIVFISPLFNSLENNILEIDVHEHREKIRYLATTNDLNPIEPRNIEARDLQLNQNLLGLRKDSDGNPKPESPSGLEKMMVSPLAWLLSRLGVESKGWAPEEFDVLIQGTLAHYVFEILFSPDSELPDEQEINTESQSILDEGILRFAPYLRGIQWQIERENLLSGIIIAALAWRKILSTLDAKILGSEQWLKGQFTGIAIHGQADAIVRLAGGQILVVDYKRSSSKSREPRMAAGYDSQAYLYIAMLNSKDTLSEENAELFKYLEASPEPGIVYYMLNDQTALTDYADEDTKKVAGWDYVSTDVSTNAISLIQESLKDIESGMVRLNREGDAGFFEKEAGIKPYALADSPLIPLFTLEHDREIVE